MTESHDWVTWLSHMTESHDQVARPSHTSESHDWVTWPSHTTESHDQVARPTHMSESHDWVTWPSHMTESHDRVTWPESHVRVTWPSHTTESHDPVENSSSSTDPATSRFQLKLSSRCAHFSRLAMPRRNSCSSLRYLTAASTRHLLLASAVWHSSWVTPWTCCWTRAILSVRSLMVDSVNVGEGSAASHDVFSSRRRLTAPRTKSIAHEDVYAVNLKCTRS